MYSPRMCRFLGNEWVSERHICGDGPASENRFLSKKSNSNSNIRNTTRDGTHMLFRKISGKRRRRRRKRTRHIGCWSNKNNNSSYRMKRNFPSVIYVLMSCHASEKEEKNRVLISKKLKRREWERRDDGEE